MKFTLLSSLLITTAFVATSASALEVKLVDKAWDGMKIPTGQQCQKFGGENPSTPLLHVTDIPKGSDAIVLEYSDRDSANMNNGGHGIMSYSLTAMSDHTEIPSVAGHTYDLPEKFTMIKAHNNPAWDKEGAYMPPCSGGKDHAYYLTVKAMEGDKITGTTVLELGKY